MRSLGTGEGAVAEVVAVIRTAIVSGRLAPGSEIALAELSEQLDVAMTTTRDALTRLADQRLVIESSDFQFRVAQASRAELAELTELRQIVEGAAVRLSVERGDSGWVQRVRESYSALAAVERVSNRPGTQEDWRAAHTAFHEALCADAHNARLTALAAILRDEAEIYRQLSDSASTPERRVEVAGEHRRLMELAVAGRGDEARDLLHTHLAGTRDAVIGSVWPDDRP
ncbi:MULTISPECIES: GntR family transcriptional regulator [unclassified Microbacterium]|uniref:GntR family transcriptional regulator n=1 Tax=unclassified Microbacterium TaxID=2609290 RepID=UPI00214C72F5|nr:MULTISPECIES: GntR family transcriptional regulator [unclassified Microbacterium]MCR2783286.1 GntR family transcriptional regulator [Microbacterium sp. zg.B96]MDL5351930.1 GntR family transcriptional regulator [Microbacterium sp. zg-YB36]WIM15839.1 GntR family transcriptional regulator [Microbacterium sp. zg-B96]